jgi:hypothetical protein
MAEWEGPKPSHTSIDTEHRDGGTEDYLEDHVNPEWEPVERPNLEPVHTRKDEMHPDQEEPSRDYGLVDQILQERKARRRNKY